ncbi:MAG: tetratricopeptide repeat protein [Saprospiraceae bacterium]
MKQILFLGFFLAAIGAYAQEGAKLAKQAGRALTSYNMDPGGNQAKLQEAKERINEALQQQDAQALASAWQTKGDIYYTIFERESNARMLNPNSPYSGDNDALVAYEAYQKAFDLGVKKFEKNDALKGIAKTQGGMINIGVMKFEAQAYDKAYAAFDGVIKSHETLSANSQKSLLDDEKQRADMIYTTALAAQLSGSCKDALNYYNQLYAKGNASAEVYEGIYNCKTELKDEAGAKTILQEGLQKYPGDTRLLFAQINEYLREGKLDELVNSLQAAINKEPENVGLYITLGNVYDNLYQREYKGAKTDKANEYFEAAKKNYEKAIEIKPDAVDAYYSLGALYYNKAAFLSQEINAIDDVSSAALRRMDAMRKEMLGLFDQALPYFQKAESVDPNDMNTLIALTEIYARKEDELTYEFKKRQETVRSGAKNPSSYFKK